MPDTRTPSFGRLVFGKAISATWEFFGSTTRDVVLAVVSLAVGFGLYWHFKGFPDAMNEAASVVAFTFAPVGMVVVVVFLWNLWLAPAALAYEEVRKSQQSSRLPSSAAKPDPVPPVNFMALRTKTKWDTGDIASILAALDSSPQSHTSKYIAWRAAVLDAMKAGKLNYIKIASSSVRGGYYPPSDDTETKKEDAITWAESIKFDMTKLK